MEKEELINILSSLPDHAEVLVDMGKRFAEIRNVKLEYFQTPQLRKPFIIINIYRDITKGE